MATVKFYLSKPKKKGILRDDEVSIIAKVKLGVYPRFEIPTGEKVPPKYWNNKTHEVKSSYRGGDDSNGSVEANLNLTTIKADIIQMWRENKKESIDSLKEKAHNIVKFGQATIPSTPIEKKTFYQAAKEFLKQYEEEKDKKTAAKYTTLVNKLIRFNHKLDFPDINFNFYDQFKSFLYAEPNPLYKDSKLVDHGDFFDIEYYKGGTIGLFDDTVYKYIIQVQTFLRWATERKYEVDQNFTKWHVIRNQYKPISLKIHELEKLEKAELTSNHLDVARDYLALECRTGQRISDLRRFNFKDYLDYKWTFSPKKGNRISPKKITVHFKGFSSKALTILAKYQFVPPKISEGKLNSYIKEVCALAGIDTFTEIFRYAKNKRIRIKGPKYEFVSTHTGRKTFISIALQHMPAKVVMDLTGIESYETLKHYEDDSEPGIIEGYLNDVQNTVNLLRKAQ